MTTFIIRKSSASVSGVDFTTYQLGKISLKALAGTNRAIVFGLQGLPSLTYRIQATTNLGSQSVWTDVATNVAGADGTLYLTNYLAGTNLFTGTNATNFPRRYFRAVAP